MRLKQRPADFKVTELLRDGLLVPRAEHRVYRVTKRKLTSLEAAQELAAELDLSAAGEISMAGLKDRQGVTIQYMSVPKGKPLKLRREGLTVEDVGCIDHPLDSEDSEGNSFEIVVRDLGPPELDRARRSLDPVREHGLPNYFDEQRFGNLRHGQGWIALALMHGQVEEALRRLLTRISDWDPPRQWDFKSAMYRHWGDWRTCRDIAGKFGAHHSIFEHLCREPEDFAGAFQHVSSRIRLIHLYSYQSHLWNRGVARFFEDTVDPRGRFAVHTREGALVFPKQELILPRAWEGTFPLPGPGLDGARDRGQLELLTELIGEDGIVPEAFRIDDVPGFQLKPEQREVLVRPTGLRMRPAEPDPLNDGRKMLRIEFSLPRGAYATLVVRRLIGPSRGREDDHGGPGYRGGHGGRGSRGSRSGRGFRGRGRGARSSRRGGGGARGEARGGTRGGRPGRGE